LPDISGKMKVPVTPDAVLASPANSGFCGGSASSCHRPCKLSQLFDASDALKPSARGELLKDQD
jgi:hypothetical protein